MRDRIAEALYWLASTIERLADRLYYGKPREWSGTQITIPVIPVIPPDTKLTWVEDDLA